MELELSMHRHALLKNISEFELLTTFSQGNLSILSVINGPHLSFLSFPKAHLKFMLYMCIMDFY